MRLERLSSWMLCFALLAPLGGCDDDDGGDDSAGDSANATEGGGNDSGNSMTSSSEETCMSSHQCINDVCMCQTPGLEGAECTNDDECVDECEICG